MEQLVDPREMGTWGSLRDPFGCPSRWPAMNCKLWTVLLPMREHLVHRDLWNNTRKEVREPQEVGHKKPQGDNKNSTRELQSWWGPLHKCCLGKHGALRNDNFDNGCLIARIKTTRTRFLSQQVLDIVRRCLRQSWRMHFDGTLTQRCWPPQCCS